MTRPVLIQDDASASANDIVGRIVNYSNNNNDSNDSMRVEEDPASGKEGFDLKFLANDKNNNMG